MSAALPEEGRISHGRLLEFDAQLRRGRVAGGDGKLYLAWLADFVDGVPPTGAVVEFEAVEGIRWREARRVRRIDGNARREAPVPAAERASGRQG